MGSGCQDPCAEAFPPSLILEKPFSLKATRQKPVERQIPPPPYSHPISSSSHPKESCSPHPMESSVPHPASQPLLRRQQSRGVPVTDFVRGHSHNIPGTWLALLSHGRVDRNSWLLADPTGLPKRGSALPRTGEYSGSTPIIFPEI